MILQRTGMVIVLVLVTGALVRVAYAQIAAIAIVQTGSLSFGSIVVGGMAGTVAVSPTGVRVAGGGVLLGNSGGAAPASFTVSGEPNTNYSIVLPASAALSGPDQDMTFDDFTTSPDGSGNLGPGGSQTVSVGATLHVNANQGHGAYAGSLSVTVTYE